MKNFIKLFSAAVLAAVIVSGCSGGGEEDPNAKGLKPLEEAPKMQGGAKGQDTQGKTNYDTL